METSPTEAQKLVERIANEYGWLSDRERDATPPNALRAIENLQTALGATMRTYVITTLTVVLQDIKTLMFGVV
jgi:hypothetical protein